MGSLPLLKTWAQVFALRRLNASSPAGALVASALQQSQVAVTASHTTPFAPTLLAGLTSSPYPYRPGQQGLLQPTRAYPLATMTGLSLREPSRCLYASLFELSAFRRGIPLAATLPFVPAPATCGLALPKPLAFHTVPSAAIKLDATKVRLASQLLAPLLTAPLGSSHSVELPTATLSTGLLASSEPIAGSP